jgi:hypothetical protein
MSNGKQFSLESGDAVFIPNSDAHALLSDKSIQALKITAFSSVLTQPAFLMQETVPQTGLLSSSITFTRSWQSAVSFCQPRPAAATNEQR